MKNKNTNTNEKRGPGRPAYVPKVPGRKFTFTDFMELNGVESNLESDAYGKGPNCSKLTLTKFLDGDMYHAFESGKRKGKANKASIRKDSIVVKLDETREPNSKSGLGRKTYVYLRRDKLDTLKPAKVTANVPRKSKVVSADYESQKAALLSPITAVTITPYVAVETPLETVEVATDPIAEVTPIETVETVQPIEAVTA